MYIDSSLVALHAVKSSHGNICRAVGPFCVSPVTVCPSFAGAQCTLPPVRWKKHCGTSYNSFPSISATNNHRSLLPLFMSIWSLCTLQCSYHWRPHDTITQYHRGLLLLLHHHHRHHRHCQIGFVSCACETFDQETRSFSTLSYGMRFTVAVAVRCRFCRVCLARYGTIENSTQLYDVRDRFIVIPNQGSSGICSCSMFGACSLAARRSFIHFFFFTFSYICQAPHCWYGQFN